MNKLQSDSFYKFLVSAGIILIIFPIIALGFFFNSEILILSQNEFDNLSEHSLRAICQKENILHFIITIFPFVACGLFLFGVGLLIYGCYKWSKIQNHLDEQVEFDTTIKKINAKKMSAEEIVNKASFEVSETEAPFDIDPVINDSNPKSGIDEKDNYKAKSQDICNSHLNHIFDYMKVEHMCFMEIKGQYRKRYNLQNNVKINNMEYDFIAVSKYDNIDIIFEVKYLRSIPASLAISNMLYRLTKAGVNYENSAHRNFRLTLIIVTPKKNIDLIKNRINQMQNENDIHAPIKIEYFVEEELLSKYNNI